MQCNGKCSDGIITKLAKFCSLRNRGLGNFLIGFTVCCFNSLFESSIETSKNYSLISLFSLFLLLSIFNSCLVPQLYIAEVCLVVFTHNRAFTLMLQ